MKIWKALAAALGAAAAAALIPYKVEKDDETNVTTVKALAWTAVKSPNGEDGGTKVDVTYLPGLAPAAAEDGEPEEEEVEDESELYDDSVELADIIPAPSAKEPAEAPAAPEIDPA